MSAGDLFWAILAMQFAALLGIGGVFARLGSLTEGHRNLERRVSKLERKTHEKLVPHTSA